LIKLSDIWPITNATEYKAHFARWNQTDHPLAVWVRSRAEWQAWQEHRPKRNDFNRPFIFSLIQFHHEPDIWLFGGVFRVVARHTDRYEVALTDAGAPFIGRLKLKLAYRDRQTRVSFENHIEQLEVFELLREPYEGRDFPGLEEIDLPFDELEILVRRSRLDWRAALSSVKGVYLLTDTITRKRYVGSAYGDGGIWGRWCSYVDSGHGGNVELRALVSDPSLEYCRRAFRFALLESRPMAYSDILLIEREQFWKNVLFSRGAEGMNRN
jgi:hypothetical protein